MQKKVRKVWMNGIDKKKKEIISGDCIKENGTEGEGNEHGVRYII